MMPKGFKQSRTSFICQRCQGHGDLSTKYYRLNLRLGKPLLCVVCRAWLHHQTEAYGTSGCVTEGHKAAREKQTMRVNGCVLVATDRGRCRDYFDCPDEKSWECLSAAAARNWDGFRRKEECNASHIEGRN